ncbi:hypothetical protein AB0M97_02275 [Streptomyces sp. NPDC051207]|uniref:hypothetical protein n=1 Tax=Streptomyces sp. NPDC051207 TaxID=3154641 RepID=UPI003449713D
MVRWRPLRRGVVRPVPEPVATPFVWAAAFAGSLLLMTLLGMTGGPASSSAALVALSLLAAVLGLPARFQAAPGIAIVCWMFLNSFAVEPRGRLSWDGHPDAARFAVLLAAAALGTVVARILHARGAHHRTTPGR